MSTVNQVLDDNIERQRSRDREFYPAVIQGQRHVYLPRYGYRANFTDDVLRAAGLPLEGNHIGTTVQVVIDWLHSPLMVIEMFVVADEE